MSGRKGSDGETEDPKREKTELILLNATHDPLQEGASRVCARR